MPKRAAIKKRLCAVCLKRPAKYIRRVHKSRNQLRVAADKNHTLCLRCHDSFRESELQKAKFTEI